MGKNKDEEREFRLRPRKPAARGERRVYASAYHDHHASRPDERSAKRRVVGFGTARRTVAHTPNAARFGSCTPRTPVKGSGEPTDVTSPAKALRMRVIRGQSGSMPLKNRSTSQRGSKVGKRPTMSGFGS